MRHLLRSSRWTLTRWMGLAAGALAVMGAPSLARAVATMAPAVSVTMTSSPNFVLDSNQPCTTGPRAAYVSYRVTNTGGSTTAPLTATISGFGSGIALGGGQPAAQAIGTLAAGASRTVYWLVEYPCTFGVAATLTVAVTDGTAGSTNGSGTVTTRSMISAGTGGALVSQSLSGGATVGGTVSLDIVYSFGGASTGDTYNFQPVGTRHTTSPFNALCFQLIGTEVIASAANAVPLGATNQTYFTATANQGGSNQQVTMRYTFKVNCANTTSTAYPYADQRSGSSNLKYSANSDTFVGPTIPGTATVSVTVAAAVTPTLLSDGGTTTYTATFTNTGTSAVLMDSVRVTLPAGVTFGALTGASGITAATSSSTPSAGSTGTLTFRAIPFSSYSVPAGGTLTLVFTQTIPAPETTYATSTVGYFGYAPTNTASATVTVRRQADLAVTKAGPASVAQGDTVRYLLTVTNTGPSAATTVVLRDTLPAGVAFARASRSATHASGVVVWPALASLANGATRTDTLWAVATTPGTVVNRAAATSDANDATPANNDGSSASSRVTTTINGYGVTTTPDGATTSQLPSNGTPVTQTFLITNTGTASDTYTLGAAASGSGILAITSVNGTAGVTGTVTVAAGAAASIAVVYTVQASAATGATSTLTLTATSQALGTVADPGTVTVTVVRPGLVIAKAAYRADQSTGIGPLDRVVPGETVWFRLTVTNTGSANASAVLVTEPLPAELAYVATAPDGPDWTITVSGAQVTGALAGTLAPSGSRVLWVRTTVR